MSAMNEILGYLIQTALSLYMVAMLLRFLLQLVRADFYNPISQFLVKITNPLVIPLRKVIPGIGGLDLASLLLAVLLQVLAIVALMLLNGLGMPNPLLLVVWSTLGIVGLLVNIYFWHNLSSFVVSFGTVRPMVRVFWTARMRLLLKT